MTQYVKFVSVKEIEFPPVNKDGVINYNLDIERLIQDGYKQLVEVERPTGDRKYEIQYENSTTVNEVLVWLETEAEYNARKLQEAKDAKKLENNTKRENIKAIKAYFSATQSGYLLKATPVGNILSVVMGIALPSMMAQQPIAAGTMRYYDNDGVQHPTPVIAADYVATFYQRFASSIAGIDAYSASIETEINNATTIAEVNAIVIDYTVIGVI